MEVPGWMEVREGIDCSGTDLLNMRVQTAAQRLGIEAIAGQRRRHDWYNRRNRRDWYSRSSHRGACINAKYWVHDAMVGGG
jgi:hypothetical protein